MKIRKSVLVLAFFTIFVVLGGAIGTASADSGNLVIEDILNGSETVRTVTGYEGEIVDLVIPDDVVAIGDRAFYECKSLKSLTILDNVRNIGKEAFAECENLKEIEIESYFSSRGSDVFRGCGGADTVTVIVNGNCSLIGGTFDSISSVKVIIADGITEVAYNAFNGAKTIVRVTIPDSVSEIGKSAFSECSGLEFVNIPSQVTEIKEKTFLNCSSLEYIELPQHISTIGNYAFKGCTNLKIDIPDDVISIGSYAFIGCSKLVSVKLPANLTEINNYTFKDCNNLVNVNFPTGLEKIGKYAFSNCESLIDLVVPNSVKSIDSFAFNHCSSLSNVTILGAETSIASLAFNTGSSPNLKIYAIPSSPAARYAEGKNIFIPIELSVPEKFRLVKDIKKDGMNLVNEFPFSFIWNSINGAIINVNGYELQIESEDSSYSETLNVTASTDREVTAVWKDALDADKIYLATVTTLYEGSRSDKSDPIRFKIDLAYQIKPPKTRDISKVSGGCKNIKPTFEWNGEKADLGIDEYTFQILNGNSVIYHADIDADNHETEVQYTLENDVEDGIYIARVRAVDVLGNLGEWTVSESFKIDNTAPSVPKIVPALEDFKKINNLQEAEFKWNKSEDDLSEPITYQILVVNGDEEDRAELNMPEDVQSVFSYKWVHVKDGKITVKVMAVDSEGNESTYGECSFVSDTIAPEIPEDLRPISASQDENGFYIINDMNPTFVWSSSHDDGSGISHYIFDIGNREYEIKSSSGKYIIYTVPEKLDPGNYVISLKAVDRAGNLSKGSALNVRISPEEEIFDDIFVEDLMLEGVAGETRVSFEMASTVSYKLVGLPEDEIAREKVAVKVTVNDEEVDESCIYNVGTTMPGTELYYVLIEQELVARSFESGILPAKITIRVEVSNGYKISTGSITYYVDNYRKGFGFGRIRP